ncbi:unnamed protein product [Adineta ricciae]|uniref:Uncharacterized protein n=1 Tax=Adineta ricciae TaxID=249248 RepID=A0A815VZ47_ADIRI|nr:unnamed protein product [Adineta ricciae]
MMEYNNSGLEINIEQDEQKNNSKQSSIIPEIRPLKCPNPVVNRLSLLPAYPTFDRFGPINGDHLLLANVPVRYLTNEQQRRRSHYQFHQPFTLTDQSNDLNVRPFFVKIYGNLYENLTKRFHIDDATLDYNYERLSMCMNIMTQERIRYGLLPIDTIGMAKLRLDEYTLAMEFYLQIDDELFFMKTCSFRNAQPSSYEHRGIFCINEPRSFYGLQPCELVTCRFCYPIKEVLMHGRQNQPVVQFSSAHTHRFLNGYETILNCPASCTTKNILYALTCPCARFDYVGYTSMTLDEQLKYHREHGNRIIHEFILGPENIKQIQQRTKSPEELIVDDILLYKHLAHCPSAIQMFLDCNPQYWHFVPMLESEAATQNLSCNLSSNNYTFSPYQRFKQPQILKNKRDDLKPNVHLDIYNASIIAVLPDNCTQLFYHLIEALFITHAQTKLNTLGHLDGMIVENNNSNNTYARLVSTGHDSNWCQNLVRRPVISYEKTRSLASQRRNPHFQ